MKFNPGEFVCTAACAGTVPIENLVAALKRHVAGDWGEVSAGDAKLNDAAVESGDRILSAYTATDGTKFWIITDAGHKEGHNVTTALLPEDY